MPLLAPGTHSEERVMAVNSLQVKCLERMEA